MSAINRSWGQVGTSGYALAWSFPLLLTVYTLFAAFDHGWATQRSAASSILPTAGIALAGLVFGGVRLWPAISLGSLIGLQLAGAARPAWAGLAFALGNGFGAASGAMVLRRFGFDPALGRLRDAVALLIGIAVAAMPAAATGTAALALAGASLPAAAMAGVAHWQGDAAGIVAVAPLLLAWAYGGPVPREARWWLHLAACLTATALLAWLAFSAVGRARVLPPHLLVALSWAALAFGPRGTAAAATIVAIGAATGGRNPFAVVAGDYDQGQILLQQFVVMAAGSGLLLAALITEQRAATARLAEANATLEQRVFERTQRLEAALEQIREHDQTKSRFFANVSHELRTPLALILGPVEALLSGRDLAPEDKRELTVVRRNARTLLAHVNDLLDLARFDEGRLRLEYVETDLAGLIESVADHFCSATMQKQVELSVTSPPVLVTQVDREKIHRVLFNLVSNACKFVPTPGGRVDITLRAEADHVLIAVADNGPGIPAGMEERIFERFIQGDHTQGGGSGLGLAIAQEFVVLHGGRISAANAPEGSGAVFALTLPRVAPAGALVAKDQAAPREDGSLARMVEYGDDVAIDPAIPDPATAGSLPLVLVVEDNQDLGTFISRALRPVARVVHAEDGVAGLMAAEQHRPDLMLTDIMMPRMSGDRMVAELRAHPELFDTPVMVLSARADEPLRIHLLRGQAQDYLVKPFAADELQARVANLLQGKRARDILRTELATREGTLEELAQEVAVLNRGLRRAAEEMEVARDRAEQGSRAKSAFLNMVSHELKTPLAQLGLQLDLLRRVFPGPLTDKQARLLSATSAAFNRMSKLVSSVVEYSRVESGRLAIQKQEFDLAKLVADACDEMRMEAERRGLEVSFGWDGAVPMLTSDPDLVGIVIRNLLDNAVKYTAQGSVSARVAALNGFLRIEVADTGTGIAPEFQTRMYEPFEQAEDIDRKHLPGIGLGLALVNEITDALGGRIRQTSAPGHGSTFTLELPLTEDCA